MNSGFHEYAILNKGFYQAFHPYPFYILHPET